VDLHRADLGGEGAARAAGDDDRGQQHAKLAREGEAEQIDGENLGAVIAQLIGALIGEDDADEKGQESDDRQGGAAGALHMADKGNEAEAPRMAQRAKAGDDDEAEEIEPAGDLANGAAGDAPELRKEIDR